MYLDKFYENQQDRLNIYKTFKNLFTDVGTLVE